MNDWLEDLKPGDKVIVSGFWRGDRVVRVARITKTLIILENDGRFRRGNGFEPGSGYHRDHLSPWTAEKEAEIMRQLRRAKVVDHISEKKSDVTDEQISKIYAILFPDK